MESNQIFLSHIDEEEKIVLEFRDLMKKIFDDTINFYVYQKNESGANLIDDITKSLNDSQILVIFCSPESISKPWINFEIGFANKMKNEDNQKTIIPVLYLDLKKEQLPSYLSNLIYVQLGLDKEKFQKSILKLIFKFAKISSGGMIFNFDLKKLESFINDFYIKYARIHRRNQSLIKLKNEMYEKVNKAISEYQFYKEKLLLKKEAELLQKIESKLSIDFIPLDEEASEINYFISSKKGYVTQISIIDFELLPKELIDFKNLKKLKISKFHNTTLPDWIGNIKNLDYLSIGNSDIEFIPDSIQHLKKLRELWLAKNKKLEYLPDVIGEISSLRHLNFSHSNVKTIPENFKKLKNLQELYLASSKVDAIPNWIDKLTKLKEISGPFKTIPESFGNLVNLEKLNSGIITNLPKSFIFLSKLEKGLILIDPTPELEPDMIHFLERLKDKGCIIIYTEEGFKDFPKKYYRRKIIRNEDIR